MKIMVTNIEKSESEIKMNELIENWKPTYTPEQIITAIENAAKCLPGDSEERAMLFWAIGFYLPDREVDNSE